MNEIILPEKPKAGVEIKSALNIPVVPAVGHLLKLKAKTRKWEPPYFDVTWGFAKKKDEELLNNMVTKLQSASKIYIATDYDAEGQLIAYNILNYAGISIDDVERMKFSSLEHNVIRNAYENTIPFDKHLALSAEVRHYLDWYFGMNISKALTQSMKQREEGLRKYNLTPVGRVQTPVLHRLTEKEKEIGQFIEKEAWYVYVRGVYDDNKLFNIKGYCFETKEDAEQWANELDKGVIDSIDIYSYETETYPPNKDYVVKECLGKGVSADVVDYIMQDLYLDGYISYPRTTSTKYLSHGINTTEYLTRVLPYVTFAFDEEILRDKPREGNEEGPHPALYPIKPYTDKDLKGVVWNIIVEAFVKCHLPPEKHESITTDIFYVDKEGNEYDIVSSSDNPDLEKGDEFDIVYRLDKGKTHPPSRYNQLKMYEWMVENKLGTVDTRTQILSKLMRTYIYQTDDGLYTSSKAVNVVDELAKFYPDIIETSLTRKFEGYIEDVRNGKPAQNVLEEGKKTVIKIIEKIKEG